jgi:hypothetical protein
MFMVLIVINGCHYTSEPQQIVVTSNSLTLAWDPPDFNALVVIYQIDYYRVYYKEYGKSSWTLIGEQPADGKLEYTLQFSDFGAGRYEFAVDYVLSNGRHSLKHSSRDRTTKPRGGWYVLWIGH